MDITNIISSTNIFSLVMKSHLLRAIIYWLNHIQVQKFIETVILKILFNTIVYKI